jgi:hypothetical protein
MPRRTNLPKYHYFNGKKYQLKWRKPYNGMGLCTAPTANAEERVITVDPNLSDAEFVETVIHEAIHAEQWYLDEDTVERIAENITQLLLKCKLISPS